MNEKSFERKGRRNTDNVDNELIELKKRIIEKHRLLEEKVLQNQLAELREEVHREMEKEIKERLENNPKPTEEEIRMAAFKEDLEPQVRDAVLAFNKKGYGTESSGFYEESKFQAIDGHFYIDENTKKKIEALGAQVRRPDIGMPENKYITQIRFYPKEADLLKIKQQWDAIARALPKTEGPEPISISYGAKEFRKQYAPNHPNLEQKIHDYSEWLKVKMNKIYDKKNMK